jgi:threonine 3-dehydrogenase
VLPMSNVWEHRPGIDLDVAALFDPFGNAVHTALKYDLLGEDVLITGAGPIGVMAAAVCRHAGARHVVITDVIDRRLALGAELGATRTVNVARETLADVQRELGMDEGFDVGLEMSGSPAAFNDMLDSMCHGGKIAILGIPGEPFAIDWNKVVFNMLTLKGIYGREMYETWYKMSVLIESGLDISPVITHRLDYREFQHGFDVMNSGEASKVILNWD